MEIEEKEVFLKVLDIIDGGLGFEHGIITNRFATATKIIEYLKQDQQKQIEELKAENKNLNYIIDKRLRRRL